MKSFFNFLNKVNSACHQDELREFLDLLGDAPNNNLFLSYLGLVFNVTDVLMSF